MLFALFVRFFQSYLYSTYLLKLNLQYQKEPEDIAQQMSNRWVKGCGAPPVTPTVSISRLRNWLGLEGEAEPVASTTEKERGPLGDLVKQERFVGHSDFLLLLLLLLLLMYTY